MNLASVNVLEMRQKIGSKKELYDFLTQECNAYLPKITCTNVYFLKSIINGEKNYLKRNEVILTAVPQIEGLTADNFIDYALNNSNFLQYLPDQCDWIHLDKKWICDVLMSLDKDGISEMIKEAKEKRIQKFNSSQNLIVQMRPEFARALNDSLQFSSKISNLNTFFAQKGRSAFLLKPSSQRKRKLKEVEEVKSEEILLNSSKQKYLEQNKRIREEVSQLQEKVDELNDYRSLVMSLHQAGIINEDGNPIQPADNIQYQME